MVVLSHLQIAIRRPLFSPPLPPLPSALLFIPSSWPFQSHLLRRLPPSLSPHATSSTSAMNFSANSILQPVIDVEIPSARSILYAAPSSATFRTILQGFLTVLIIKECVSLTRYFVKSSRANSDNSLDINRILLWVMVEDWDDLFKVFFRRIFFSRPLHLLDSPFQGMRVSFDRVGLKRLAISGSLAFLLLSVDVVLLFLQLPDNRHQDVRNMRKLAWHNNGTLVNVAADNVLVGSFSRVVKLNSTADDNQFIRLPSVSIERTDYRDFTDDGDPPNYNGKLLNCTKKEGWRMLCRIHCRNRFYQYKLRLDVSTDTNSSFFFVPTAGFNFSLARVSEYVTELRRQLSIPITDFVIDGENERQQQQEGEEGSNNGPDSFQLYTNVNDLPPERVALPVTYAPSATANGRVETVDILTHDAVATIILGSIVVSTTNESSLYVVRQLAERRTVDGVIFGTVAISQTPYITLFGTLIMYVVLQSFSIFLQTRLKLHVSSPEISALLESVGVSCTTNWGNVRVPPVRAHYSYDVNEQGEQVGHIGYFPATFLARIRKFLDEGPYDENENDDGRTMEGGKQGVEVSMYSEMDIATDTATATDLDSYVTTAEKWRRRERLENEYNVVDKGTFFEFSKFGQKDGVVRTVVSAPKTK